MSTNVSEYTYNKMLEFNVSSVGELLKKLQDKITVQEARVKYRNEIKNKASIGNKRVKIRISDSFRGCEVYSGKTAHIQNWVKWVEKLRNYDVGSSELKKLKDIKQRVLLNQSLRNIEHNTPIITEKFEYKIGDFPKRPKGNICRGNEYHNNWLDSYWNNKSDVLDKESTRLELALKTYSTKLSMKEHVKPIISKQDIPIASTGILIVSVLGYFLLKK